MAEVNRSASDLSAALAAASDGQFAEDDTLAVAVSGGADSLALLRLAHEAYGSRVRVLTVDHGLRSGSAGDAAHVAQCAAQLNLSHATLTWTGPKRAGNVQAAARGARYRLMADWCAAHGGRWLVTAHHADDQAETLLLRLARGSGSAGLAGIRRRRELGGGVTLLRPLLDWRRSDLAAVVTAAGWTAVDDPANRATRFDRTQARALLAATPWLRPERLAAAAAHLAEGETALAWTAALAWSSRAEVKSGGAALDAAGLPGELQRRLLVRMVATLAPGVDASGPSVERWRTLLVAGRRATLGGITGVGGSIWRFGIAPPRRRVRDQAAATLTGIPPGKQIGGDGR